ncbi:MAG: L,D-transpeptidase family protein, partial [Gammaproteobacteria bacterium]
SMAMIADFFADDADADQSLRALGVARSDYISAIYALGGNVPLWTQPARVHELLDALAGARRHGLDADDYHYERLQTLRANTAPIPAALDILLTDALARVAYHLRFGKANPQEIDANWNYSRALETRDPARWMFDAIVEQRITAALDGLQPHTPMYAALQRALERYRAIADAGGWPLVAPGPTLKPGFRDARVTTLRERLAAETFIASAKSADSALYDPELELAVREFQRRYGLAEDGAVGKQTLAALNVPAAARVATLRVNLERVRWIFRDFEDELLVVNIAAFQAAYLRGGEILWRARAVVGRPYRQTPIFKALMTHVITNPTWTVPPTILRKDVLPAMARDPAYLKAKRLRVFDRAGNAVNPDTIDWQRTRSDGFPYVLRQDPGAHNALGRIKFMFPNPHIVYLHDTPSRELFERAERTFSSGCIRVEHPFELATLLLRDDPAWQPENTLAETRPRRFDLNHAVTVMLLYLTAFADADGKVQFRRDVYARDAAVLRALDGPFTFSPPRGYRTAD